MNQQKVTLSFKKIKLFGGLFFLALLLFILFAVFEKNSIIASAPIVTPSIVEDEVPVDASSQTLPETPIPTQIATIPPQVFPTFSNITPYNLPPGINPLTGLPPSEPGLLERRPIASKITLYPRYVRPQVGLSFADVAFEYYIEGGLTRFIAVFYGSNAERIGPVRSGRFFDEHVARMYQSYLVFKYADKRVYDYLKETDIRDFLIVPGNSYCPPFLIGESERDTYNNIFLNAAKFSECLERQGKDDTRPDLHASYFSDFPPPEAESALGIFAQYSLDDYHHWQYNSSSRTYLRFQETNDLRNNNNPGYAALFDGLTNQQIAAENVIYLFVPHTFEDQFQEEDEVYHINLVGSGKAFLFRDGIVLPAYWQRVSIDQPLRLVAPNGMPISLKPGRSFYQVLGESSSFSAENTIWRFEFETP